MTDIEKIMALAGTNDNEDLDTQLNKVSQLITLILNQVRALRVEWYTWKFEYINEGNAAKISKMEGDTEVSWVILDRGITYSDNDDEDLKKIAVYLVLGSWLYY